MPSDANFEAHEEHIPKRVEPQEESLPVSQIHEMIAKAKAPPSMGLTGIIATIANTTEVVVVTALFIYFVTVLIPIEHERAAAQRQVDRESHAAETKAIVGKFDERLEKLHNRNDDLIQKLRDADDARLSKLWDNQTKLQAAIASLTAELRVHGKLMKDLPKIMPQTQKP